MYSVIQYSKFKWMEESIALNPHGSDTFFWLMLVFRFFDDFDLDQNYPGENALEALEGMGESFLLQMNCDSYPDLFKASELLLVISMIIDLMF